MKSKIKNKNSARIFRISFPFSIFHFPLLTLIVFALLISGCATSGRVHRLERLSEEIALKRPEVIEPARVEIIKEPEAVVPEPVAAPPPTVYPAGEKLTYRIRWLGISVGYAILEIKGIEEIDGRKVYHISSVTRSNDFLSKIYPVEDRIESYVDIETLLSRRFKKSQREGRYRAQEEVNHDQVKHRGHYHSLKNNTTKEFDILPNSQDTLSALYYFRFLNWKAGDVVAINVSADEKKYVLEVRVLEKQVLEMRNLGVYQTVVVEPMLKFQGLFRRRGRVWVWFSEDERRIPLMMETKVPIIGSVTATLERIE